MGNRAENITVDRSKQERAPWVLVAGGFHQGGGMDKANAALAKYLIERKTPLHLVSHRVDAEFFQHPGVRVHLVPRPASSFFMGEWFLHRRGRAVARRVVRQWPDARVVVNGGNCMWPDINWVHMVHHASSCADDGAPWGFKIKNRLVNKWARKRECLAIRSARFVLANSKRTRRDLITFLGIDPDKIHTVYLGTDPMWAPPPSAERSTARRWLGKSEKCSLAGFVGAMGHDQGKGFDILWSAWRRLCARSDWDVDLIVAGGGSGVGQWKAEVAKARLSHRVQFLGFTDRVRELLAAADLLVSPVRYEAFGLNVQEAICRGIPALVSASAGIAELYPAELSEMLLPDPEDTGDLIARLLRWRSQRDYWKRAFLPFSNALRSYSWRNMARRIIEIVESTGPGDVETFTETDEADRIAAVNYRPVSR